jgi:hypothetical protein
MLSRFMKTARAVGYSIALVALSGSPVWAQASQCPKNAIGGQTGRSYTLRSQSLVTETRTVQLSLGGAACGVGGSAGGTIAEQYNVGYYEAENGDTARVDCRTGQIIGWV